MSADAQRVSASQVIVIVWLCRRQSPVNSEAEISPYE